MPVLSVIVPSYHASAYLSRCLDSIIGQTLKDLEIIVVSDGSAADFAICRRYAEKDERVKFLKGRETGVGGARNVGLDAASGTYIAFVDADDWIEPNTFEESLSYFPIPILIWFCLIRLSVMIWDITADREKNIIFL